MVERFLRYSLERGRRICVVTVNGGVMKKRNMLVTAMDADGAGFCARLPGRKQDVHISLEEVLTAAYARGDQGELE